MKKLLSILLLLLTLTGVAQNNYQVVSNAVMVPRTTGLIQLSTPTLTPTVISGVQIDLSWTNVSNESSYMLEWSPTGAGSWTQIGGTIAANTTTYSHTSLTASTTYYYRISAIGDGVTYSTSGFGTANATTTSSFDSDAQAYFTATGITDNTIKGAVNQLVLDLKSYSLWSIGQIINPVAGGSDATHKYNLKDPRDLDAAFRLTFSGGITHASTGMTGNGSSGYADTKFSPNSNFSSASSASIAIYSRTNSNGTTVDIGATNGNNRTQIYSRFGDIFYGQVNTLNTFNEQVANTSSVGFFLASRTGSNTTFIQKNATQTTGFTDGVGTPTSTIYVMARNNAGNAFEYSPREISFIWVGAALSTTQAANLNTAVQTYITAMGR